MATKLIRSLSDITPEQKGGVVTIGNFDGVHLGHQQLIKNVIDEAKKYGASSTAITFEPHPFEFFHQENLTIPRITRLREKFSALADCGIDNVLILQFNQELASKSASDFVTQYLYEPLRPKHIIIGDDFHFGAKRSGNLALLTQMGKELGFSVEALQTVLLDGERVSSTRIRKVLGEGDLALAARLLGRPYSMMGRISRGRQLGREFGFPTANIFLHRKLTPIKGVYTVSVHGIGDKPLPGVANVGIRPTVDGTRALLEVHLLDFNQEVYGSYVRVDFCQKLRDEVRYPNVELLKEQIARDVEAARNYFQQHGAL